MRRLYGMATDITLMNVIAEAVARMAHRAENTPAKPERARHISITKRSIGPKQKVVLSARDELPESTRPVRHRPL
ncbi:MAG TPA: hypothetical protein PK765_01825 [bacterium]|nr:hypothetical protein [bacterium]